MNPFSRSLLYSIDNVDNTIDISGNQFGLNKHGGMLVIDRRDAYGNATPSLQEYITYDDFIIRKGVVTLRGVQRGAMGSSATSHSTASSIDVLPYEKETAQEIHPLEEELKKLL
jgi:hypothetical protein